MMKQILIKRTIDGVVRDIGGSLSRALLGGKISERCVVHALTSLYNDSTRHEETFVKQIKYKCECVQE